MATTSMPTDLVVRSRYYLNLGVLWGNQISVGLNPCSACYLPLDVLYLGYDALSCLPSAQILSKDKRGIMDHPVLHIKAPPSAISLVFEVAWSLDRYVSLEKMCRNSCSTALTPFELSIRPRLEDQGAYEYIKITTRRPLFCFLTSVPLVTCLYLPTYLPPQVLGPGPGV